MLAALLKHIKIFKIAKLLLMNFSMVYFLSNRVLKEFLPMLKVSQAADHWKDLDGTGLKNTLRFL